MRTPGIVPNWSGFTSSATRSWRFEASTRRFRAKLVKALGRLGYHVTRQTGSHLRLTRSGEGGEHHLTVPNHDPLKLGTLNSILRDVAGHTGLTRDELLERLFG